MRQFAKQRKKLRDEGKERHAGDTDDNEADHRADHAEKQLRGHVLKPIKNEADEAEHHDVEGVRLVERIAVKEPERAEDDTEDQGPDGAGHAGVLADH